MQHFFTTNIGRLRLLGFTEGLSYLILLFIAMPIKYMGDNPLPVKIVGQIHGILFVLFVINTISVAIDCKWKFTNETWKVLVSSLLPFGTFYVDNKILKPLQEK